MNAQNQDFSLTDQNFAQLGLELPEDVDETLTFYEKMEKGEIGIWNTSLTWLFEAGSKVRLSHCSEAKDHEEWIKDRGWDPDSKITIWMERISTQQPYDEKKWGKLVLNSPLTPITSEKKHRYSKLSYPQEKKLQTLG